MKKTIYISLLAAIAVFLVNLLLAGSEIALRNAPYYFLFSLGFSIVNFGYFRFIGKALGWEDNPERTLIISLIGVIPLNAALYFIMKMILRVLVFSEPVSRFIARQQPVEYLIVVLFALLIALIILIGFSFKKISAERLRTEQLLAQNEKNKYENLKSQLDPHFLFNNLNVLTALIEENPQRAAEFSTALSGIYQYVLRQKEQALVPLQSELDFARKYLELLKMRYEDALEYSLPESAYTDYEILPLSLQVLLENAVKHNRFSTAQPLKISVEIERDHLIVTNNSISANQSGESTGTGLSNLNARYELTTGMKVKVSNEGNYFRVEVPLVKPGGKKNNT